MLENLKHLTKCTNEVPLKKKKRANEMVVAILVGIFYFPRCQFKSLFHSHSCPPVSAVPPGS